MVSVRKTQQTVNLGDVLDQDYLPLPRLAMRMVGAATQTLGALYRITAAGNEHSTFQRVESIADMACVSVATCRRHLERLTARKWIQDMGHGRSKRRIRRTRTYRLTSAALKHRTPYAMLPRLVIPYLRGWARCAVFALIVSRHILIQTVSDNGSGEAYNREEMSISGFQRDSGLPRRSVTRALQWLRAERFIDRECGWDDNTGFWKAPTVINAELRLEGNGASVSDP